VEWADVAYSEPPECRGQAVECRVEVGADVLEVRWAAREVARHRLAPAGSPPQWDPAHRRAAEAEALGRARGGLRLVPPGDPEALRRTLERLVSDRGWAAQLGAAGQAHVYAHFTLEQMVKRVDRLYRELIGRKWRVIRET
jgi:hypothetical protein